MKTSIWIENGVVQLVLTPETKWEESVTKTIEGGEKNTTIYRGGFYECHGGWTRQSTSEESLIIRVDLRDRDDAGTKTPGVAP